jgi:hypothetical protein
MIKIQKINKYRSEGLVSSVYPYPQPRVREILQTCNHAKLWVTG